MRAYTRKLDGKTYSFRLTIGAQRELREKYNEDTLQTILTAPNDVNKMSGLLGAAASYQGNANAVTDGDALYDLLVDDGVCGPVGFTEVAAKIAVASGIFDEKSQIAFSETIQRDWNRVWDGLSEKPADPMITPSLNLEQPEPPHPEQPEPEAAEAS